MLGGGAISWGIITEQLPGSGIPGAQKYPPVQWSYDRVHVNSKVR